ncbi:MAG: hypothetical protein LRY28_05400 [Erysipelotrichaceae bacterium]|nr:hypothetical protein [Erysipelotrichaceae bacterium]
MKQLHLGHRGWLVINVINMMFMTSLNGLSIYLLRFITDYGLSKQLNLMLQTAQWMLLLLVFLLIADLIGTYLRSRYIESSLILMKKAIRQSTP